MGKESGNRNHTEPSLWRFAERFVDGDGWRIVAILPGIAILYLMGLALVFNRRLDGGAVEDDVWLFSIAWAVLGTALVGLTVFRFSKSPVDVTRSRLLTIFVLAGSIFMVFGGSCVMAMMVFDWELPREFGELVFFGMITLGPFQGTITAVEWHRISARGGAIRVISLVIASPSYLLCALWIFAWFFFRYGSSVV